MQKKMLPHTRVDHQPSAFRHGITGIDGQVDDRGLQLDRIYLRERIDPDFSLPTI
jgi:hypothetical protein